MGFLLFGGAGGAESVDGDFGVGDSGSFRQLPELAWVQGLDGVGVGDGAAGGAMEMDVLLDVGAVTGLGALDLDELDEAVAGEVLQAIIDGG